MKSSKFYLRTVVIPALVCGMLAGCGTGEALSPSGSTQLAVSNTAETTLPDSASTREAIQIVFTDSGITASSSQGIRTEDTALIIEQAGTYLLSGTCENGTVKVKKGVTGVQLVLNGLTLTSETTAPIVCAKSTQVTLEVAAGTDNTLSDTAQNNDNTGNTDAENAVIKCKDGSNVVLCGSGTLNIHAAGKNGIKSGAATQEEGTASLTIRDLTLNIQSPVNDAINAEALLNVESGTLTISAGDDALHCDNTLNIGTESTQPTIQISASYEGLEGATVNIYSGDISIVSTDDCINAANSDLQSFDYQLNIYGGTIDAYTSSGDGFDSNGDMTISGGTVVVWCANTADNEPLDADGTVTISGGTVLAAGSIGMGLTLNAQQPCAIFGLNSSTSENTQMQQPEEPPVQPGESSTEPEEPPAQQEDKSFRQSGGGGGMPGFQSTAAVLSQGDSFSVVSSDGTILYQGEARCNASFLLFSSEETRAGESCTLRAQDTETVTEIQSGTISAGGFGGRGNFPGNGDFRQPSGDFGGDRPNEQRPSGGKPDMQPSQGSSSGDGKV